MLVKMKKTLLWLLFCLLIINHIDAKLFVSTHDIKVRKGKGSHATVLGFIKNGTIIDVTDTDGQWGMVVYGNKEGFVKTKYLRPAAPAAPAAKEETGNPPGSISILLFTGGLLLSVFLIKRLITAWKFGTFRRSRSKKAPEANQQNLPVYWYQCKHCNAIVKKSDHPSHKGCLRSTLHHWTQMAEVGGHKYYCKQCLTTIQSATIPSSDGCPGGVYHTWTQRNLNPDLPE